MLGLVDYVIGTKKIDNMGRAGSVEVLARLCLPRWLFSPVLHEAGAGPREKMAISKSMNQVYLFSLIHYFGVSFSVLRSFMVW